MLVKKKLATTPRGARQLIVHKNVLVDGKVVNIPSFVVTKDLEGKIALKEKKVKVKKVEEKVEEAPVEDKVEEIVEEKVEEVKPEEVKE
jgi:small subunit ribosomal protein S4